MGLTREFYGGISGLSISEFTNHARFPDSPDRVDVIGSFETPPNQGDNYGQRLRGYLRVPASGDYIFYVASDDQGILYLSPDTNPGNKQPIAWESMWNMPRNWVPTRLDPLPVTSISPPIPLAAGQWYYVEALHKQGPGGNNFGVAWQLPGGTPPVPGSPPIAGEFLAPFDSEPAPDHELHVVAVSSGNVDGHGSTEENQEGVAQVLVNRPGKSVTLFIGGYYPILWSVTVTPGTTLERVILGGVHRQRIEGIPLGTPVLHYYADASPEAYLYMSYTFMSCEFYRMLPKIVAIAGMGISSYRGVYIAPGEPFVIDQVQNDPRLQPEFPQPVDLSGLPNLSFQLAFSSANTPGSSGTVSYRNYTLAGVEGGGQVLDGMRVIPDSGGRYLYAARHQDVMRIDRLTGAVEAMQPGPGDAGWPMGMAYDSKRDRVVLVTLSGEGWLFSYSPSTRQWIRLRSMDNIDLDNLVYHAAEDAFYGTETSFSRGAGGTLYRLNAEGLPTKQIPLPQLCLYGGEYGAKVELVSVGEYLVAVVGLEDVFPWSGPPESRIYLIDPRTGEVKLTSRSCPLNACPEVAITSPAAGSRWQVGNHIPLKARATDPGGRVASVQFHANGAILGRGTPSGNDWLLSWTNPPVGEFSLTAVAIDSGWCMRTSAPVNIVVHEFNSSPAIICPPPRVVTATTETGQAAFVPVPVKVQDPDGDALTVKWIVDGVEVASSNLLAGTTAQQTVIFTGLFQLGERSVTVTVKDWPAGIGNQSSDSQTVSCSTTVTVLHPVARLVPAREDQDYPAVASDGTNYFVAWLDRRNCAGKDWTACDVYGARVGRDGTVLDRNGILIGLGADWSGPPAIAFDGRNFLVVWVHNMTSSTGTVRGTRVSPAGIVLDGPSGIQIGKALGRLQSNPSVAFNGYRFFVAWIDWRNQTSGPDNLISDIYGARVTPSGEVLDPENIAVIRAPLWQSSPAVASAGADFCVIWRDMDSIRGARVNVEGGVTAPFVVSEGPIGDVGIPALAPLGAGYVAAWPESFNRGDNIVRTWLFGRRLSPTGVPVEPAFPVCTNTDFNGHLALGNGKEFDFVAWESRNVDGTQSRVLVSVVPLSGPVLGPRPVSFISAPQTHPSLAVAGSTALVAWQDMRHASNSLPSHLRFGDIYGSLVPFGPTVDPPVIEPRDFLISSETVAPPVVTWPTPGPITYGTALGPAQLNATASVPGTMMYNPPAGTVLNAGLSQVLQVVFTPSDLSRYWRVTNSVRIDVLRANLTIRADDKTKTEGTANPPLTASYVGFVRGETPAVLDSPAVLATAATEDSPPGAYPITVSGAADANYNISFVNGTLTVRRHATGPGYVDLDRSTPLDPGYVLVHSLAQVAGDKIIVGGYFETTGPVLRTNIARLNPDGSVDPEFHVKIPTWEVFAVVPQPDGKLLVGLPALPPPPECLGCIASLGLIRLNADGSVDTTFQVLTEEAWGGVRSIALQPDGKILIGGMFGLDGRSVLARLNPDGSVDHSFDAGQIYVWEGDDYVVRDLILQPDGKILVRGDIDRIQGVDVNGFFRLLPNGQLDEAFFTGQEWVSAVVLEPAGTILIGGTPGEDMTPGMYRLQPNGLLDSSFAQEGASIIPTALLLQEDGRILASGSEDYAPQQRVFRFHTDGELDEGFDSGTGANSMIWEMLLLPEHVLVGGTFDTFDGIPRRGLAWLHRDPPPPSSFVKRTITGTGVSLAANPPANTLVYAIEERLPANWLATDIDSGGVWDAASGKVKFGPFFDKLGRTLSYKVVPPPGFAGVAEIVGVASADGVSSPVTGDRHVVISAYHPADRPASDWRLTVNEVTAYGAAWRDGKPWEVPPVPIPIEYVTRAGALWRGGETYVLDPSLGGPPMWWVNAPTPPRPLGLGEEGLMAVRAVRGVCVAGEPVEAEIRVSPGVGTAAYALQETIPGGWEVVSVGGDGRVDAETCLLKWGPFFDAAERVLRYTLKVPRTQTGTTVLAGIISVDGVNTEVSGPRALQATSKLAWRQVTGRMALIVRGGVGANYVVESSSDLRTWTNLGRFTNSTGEIEVPEELLPRSSATYYRARQVEVPAR